MTWTIEDKNDDVINLSDITDRVDELRELRDAVEEANQDYEDAREAFETAHSEAEEENDHLADLRRDMEAADEAMRRAQDDFTDEEREELKKLEKLLDEIKGYGGDHQWDSDWYPGHLIARSYFVDYCEELVKDIGDLPKDIPSYIEIDWKATADNLEEDYSSVDFEGMEFLYR